jgi:hypothetical protein
MPAFVGLDLNCDHISDSEVSWSKPDVDGFAMLGKDGETTLISALGQLNLSLRLKTNSYAGTGLLLVCTRVCKTNPALYFLKSESIPFL